MPTRPPAVREKPNQKKKKSQSLARHRGVVSRFVVNSMHSFIEKTAECRNSHRVLTFLASVACAGMNGPWLSACLAGHQVTDEGAR